MLILNEGDNPHLRLALGALKWIYLISPERIEGFHRRRKNGQSAYDEGRVVWDTCKKVIQKTFTVFL